MRWASFPGEALLQQVQMEVNGNPLDQYTFHATNMHREYRVAPNKILGWYRCVGQETPQNGYVAQPNWNYSNVSPAAIQSRVNVQVYVGNQTPTGQKPQTGADNLEMFIPLLFWYNKDVRLAVPSVAIPYGQRFININLATLTQLVGYYPRGLGTWTAPNGSISEPSPTLSLIELYINNIFVNPEVHKIYIKRIGFSLIRVHRQQLYNANTNSAEVLLQQLKWPIEYLFVGMKITNYFASSTASTTAQYLNLWNTFSLVTANTATTQGQNILQSSQFVQPSTATISISTAGVVTLGGTGTPTVIQAVPINSILQVNGVFYGLETTTIAAGTGAGVIGTVNPAPAVAIVSATAANCFVETLQGLTINYNVKSNTMDTVTITAHGITIYDTFPTAFFNAYTSYHYGGPNINTPTDSGLVFIPFDLYPGTYQPSGHINVSRAREFYISYTSSVISSGTPGTLVVIASAINFLLISDGSAVLRYST